MNQREKIRKDDMTFTSNLPPAIMFEDTESGKTLEVNIKNGRATVSGDMELDKAAKKLFNVLAGYLTDYISTYADERVVSELRPIARSLARLSDFDDAIQGYVQHEAALIYNRISKLTK